MPPLIGSKKGSPLLYTDEELDAILEEMGRQGVEIQR